MKDESATKSTHPDFLTLKAFGGGGGWNSRRDYMGEKVAKMRAQRRVEDKSSLFHGLSFWMTGRTRELNDTELKQIIEENGGRYEPYGFTRVSHIVCDNLAMANQRWQSFLGHQNVRRAKIVTPDWVVGSVAVKRRLPEANYLPKCLRQRPAQKKKKKPTMSSATYSQVRRVSWSGEKSQVFTELRRLHKELPREYENRRVTLTSEDAVWCGPAASAEHASLLNVKMQYEVTATLTGERSVRAPYNMPQNFVERLVAMPHVEAAKVLIGFPPTRLSELLPRLDDQLRALTLSILRRRYPDFCISP